MVKTTRAQRVSLFKLYNRAPIIENGNPISYRILRSRAYPEFGFGAILIQWAGMTVGIEKDGYTHT